MSASRERGTAPRRRDNWSVISGLTIIGLVLIAVYLIPQAVVEVSFVLYGLAVLLAIVTFVVPAIVARIRQHRAAHQSQSDTESSSTGV